MSGWNDGFKKYNHFYSTKIRAHNIYLLIVIIWQKWLTQTPTNLETIREIFGEKAWPGICIELPLSFPENVVYSG